MQRTRTHRLVVCMWRQMEEKKEEEERGIRDGDGPERPLAALALEALLVVRALLHHQPLDEEHALPARRAQLVHAGLRAVVHITRDMTTAK